MAFPQELAKYIEEDKWSGAAGYPYVDGVEVISDEIEGQGRWMTFHKAVVKHEDRFWAIEYAAGSTEYQDNDDEYTVYEVEPVEKTVTVYVRK